MASFYNYYQNPSGFCFLVKIMAICFLHFIGFTKFKYQRKNEMNSGLRSKKTSPRKWLIYCISLRPPMTTIYGATLHRVKLSVTACFAKNLVMNRITASGQQAVNLFIPRYRSELLACSKTIDLSVYIWKKCKYWCNDWQAIKSNFSLPLIRIFFFLIIFKMFHRLFVLIIHCSLDGPSELFCGKWLPWVRYIKCFDWC